MPGPTPRTDGGSDTLTAEQIAELADAYEHHEPFDLVEREHTETLPKAFAAGDFGRRDAEWVVQWFYRRGDIDDSARREAEERFLDNDYETMVDGIQGAAEATAFDDRIESLTALTGVDLPVATAFLAYTHPDEYVALGEREWTTLYGAGELDEPYPDDVTAADYERYLDAVRAVAARTGHDLWTVYRALWRRGD